jgi:hypothetical protein
MSFGRPPLPPPGLCPEEGVKGVGGDGDEELALLSLKGIWFRVCVLLHLVILFSIVQLELAVE